MEKTILIGTGNPAKLGFFASLLKGSGYRLLSPADMHITQSPPENGKTPLENAQQKTLFYGQYAPVVFATDSGMRFDSLPADDPRQPGLHLRSPYGKRLTDEEMLAYYAGLVRGLGGSVLAYYQDAFALKVGDTIYPFEASREELLETAFTLRDTPVEKRVEGWPLDSISWDWFGVSFLDGGHAVTPQEAWGYLPRLRAFTWEKLGL